MNNWLDLSDNANTFLSTMVDGFVDTSGGNIIVRDLTTIVPNVPMCKVNTSIKFQ